MMPAINALQGLRAEDLLRFKARDSLLLNEGCAVPEDMKAIRRRVSLATVRIDEINAIPAGARDETEMAIAQMGNERLGGIVELIGAEPGTHQLQVFRASRAPDSLHRHALLADRQKLRQFPFLYVNSLELAEIAKCLRAAIAGQD